MIGKAKATRLGDILLEKGLISADQLQLAIAEQKRRRVGLSHTDKEAMDATCIGEILVDLGFISRQQLKRGLNWQMYLRKMTLVMSLCAPLMGMAGGAAAQTTTPTSTRGAPISLTIQAEEFSAMKGIKVEATTDVGGGSNIGSLDAGDWMAYENAVIELPVASTYKVTYRVSSLYGGGSFYLHELGSGVQYDVVTVPRTGNFQKWIDVEHTITLPAGTHKLGITATVKGSNINWFKLEYKGVALPVTIQAEDFAAQSGVKVEPTKDVGGGSNIGAIDAGDWLSYENTVVDIPAAGNYKVTYRVSSLYGGGSFSFHEADGSAQYDVVSVPKTGNFQKFIDVERIITLNAGSHIFGMTAITKGYNLNWFKIEPADAGAALGSGAVSSSSSSSSSSSQASVSSATSSAPVVTSSSSSTSTASSANSSAASTGFDVVGPVHLSWRMPTVREDMSGLGVEELGGYEIRYRKAGDETYTYISIEDPNTVYYEIPWLEGNYIFQIAAFDKNGLYSKFMDLRPGG